MVTIIRIEGNVKYPITLDPGVWIFDDRRLDLDTYFGQEKQQEINEMEEYTKAVSKHWEREIREGAIYPPTLKTEKRFEKEKLLTGSFGIKFKPFLENAEPNADASTVIFTGVDQELEVKLETAKEMIFAFSANGKPLKEDGPVHLYYGDGSNHDSPIKSVVRVMVK